MEARSISTFKYNLRAPDSQVDGPIRFVVGQTVLGKVIVERSQRGICTIFLGEDVQGLRDQLPTEFACVELQADQALMERELTQVIGFIDQDTAEGVINPDIGDTAFEQKVWQALCGIPAGMTRGYSDVAREVGVPKAVRARAVASACAANTLAIAIPCHRVVCSDGTIFGYRWGVERKRALLADEATETVVLSA